VTDLEAFMVQTISYALDFKETVLFCRMCGQVTLDPENVAYRYCGHCYTFHDNIQLEKWIKEKATTK
jgi:hypothetical protein